MNTMTQHFIFSESIPTFALWIASALAFFLWIRLRSWKPSAPNRWERAIPPIARGMLCFVALVFLSQALQRHLIFATNWPIWVMLLAGAVSAETVLALYAFECRILPRRESIILPGLRALLVILVAFALCQPVKVFEISRKIDRYVAVAIDNSASMGIPCSDMGTGEKIRLAEYLSILKAKRPFRSEDAVAVLDRIRQETAAQTDGITAISQTSKFPDEKNIAEIRSILKAARNLRSDVAAQREKTNELLSLKTPVLGEPVKAKINLIIGRMNSEVVNLHDERIKLLETAVQAYGKKNDEIRISPNYSRMIELGRLSMASLQGIEKETSALGDEIDAALFSSLPEGGKADVEAISKLKRADLAEKILSTPQPAGKDKEKTGSLMQKISDKYGVKAYDFAIAPSEIDPAKLKTGGSDTKAGKKPDSASMGTNMASVFAKSLSDIPPGQLAGILLLSDGRHNGSDSIESIAARLGEAKIPVCSISFGAGPRPLKDAAVLSVEVPDSLYLDDTFNANVNVKLTGLSGQKICLKLSDGANLVTSREIDVKSDYMRDKISLTDKPKTAGYHSYKVAIDPVEGELVMENNQRAVPVNVTDDCIKVLYVEGSPRWEFRYLKNLFVSRDRSVRLQYVLLRPDRIENQQGRAPVAASASRAIDDAEATLLPATEGEWMKFDVIVLGDVDAGSIGKDGIGFIKKFVAERAGTLILVAGSAKMPNSYFDTPLAELIPVNFKPVSAPFIKAPGESYRIALTQEGEEHIIMQLSPSPAENLKIWNGIPPFYWRYPIVTAKPGAAVLAFAMPFDPPSFLKSSSSSEVSSEELLRKRRQFELENALVICQNYALGKVAMLTFDETWRLRYRNGDIYHHKFWGQLLRWATADKIMFGAACVRLAPEKSRYSPDEDIKVRAKITQRDFTPVTDANTSVRVLKGGTEVARNRLHYEPGSPGIYSGGVGTLPEGDYRLELVCDNLPAGLETDAGSVHAEFGVSAALPDELAELAADTGTLNRIAAVTGGAVFEPSMAPTALEKFGPPSLIQTESRQISVWNSWPFLMMLIALAVIEWLLRKKVNLP